MFPDFCLCPGAFFSSFQFSKAPLTCRLYLLEFLRWEFLCWAVFCDKWPCLIHVLISIWEALVVSELSNQAKLDKTSCWHLSSELGCGRHSGHLLVPCIDSTRYAPVTPPPAQPTTSAKCSHVGHRDPARNKGESKCSCSLLLFPFRQ